MKTYINDLLANLEEAQLELQPRVADGECKPLVSCMEKINEILTAVRYWEYVTENGGLEQCEGAAAYFDTLFMNTIAEDLAEAMASAFVCIEKTNWKDKRLLDAHLAMEEADQTVSLMKWEAQTNGGPAGTNN